MGTDGALIGGAAGTQAFASISGGIFESSAQKSLGKLEQQTAETNARLSELQAQDAIERGKETQEIFTKQVSKVIGKQRAGFAASGVKVGVGSAADVVESTRAEARKDFETIKNNAWREAWGYRFQAQQQRFAGDVAKLTRETASKSALIAGGLKGLSHLGKGAFDLKGAFKTTAGSGGSAPIFGGLGPGGHPREPKLET